MKKTKTKRPKDYDPRTGAPASREALASRPATLHSQPAHPKEEKPKKVRKVKKKEIEKPKKVVEKAKPKPKPAKYFEAIGRRKTAVARVRLFTRGLRPTQGSEGFADYPSTEDRLLEKEFLVNERPLTSYFPTLELQQIATASIRKMRCLDRFRVSAKLKGGGLHAQAEALRQGIARALVLFSPDFRKRLRKVGYLTRDSRERERKKFGLKRARRAPQWQKR